MSSCNALTEFDDLTRLIESLHGHEHPICSTVPGGWICLFADPRDPESHIAYVVPKQKSAPLEAGKEAELRTWIIGFAEDLLRSNHIDSLVAPRRVYLNLLSAVFPGKFPETTIRERVEGLTVRALSALNFIWIDKLGLLTREERSRLSETVSSGWKTAEADTYVVPSFETRHRNSINLELDAHPPSFPSRAITLVYGPGGIGKTQFLRRNCYSLTRAHQQELLNPLPIFIRLPSLLDPEIVELTIYRRYDAFKRLTINEITTLMKNNVVMLFLDAFDEVLRGREREYGRKFLDHLVKLSNEGGQIILSSRDYYFTIDPLIPAQLTEARTAEVTLRYFDKQGRKGFLRNYTQLPDSAIAKWSQRLEQQVRGRQGTLSGSAHY